MTNANQPDIEIRIIESLAEVPAGAWDACACPEARDGRPLDPFTTHRFLLALERSGSVGPGTGWHPRHLTLWLGGDLIACAPLYAKTHSQGEYIFDFGWADAYQRAGGSYYPKLQIAVPFTPATGRRFLVRPDHAEAGRAALIAAAVQLVDDNAFSSLHVTYCTAEEVTAGAAQGLLARQSQQYHWLNAGYGDFDGFLSALSSRKRKAIRRERAQAQGFGGTIHHFTGDDLRAEHWDAFWRFYQDTGARKWGRPYLTRAFFDEAQAALRDDILLVMARRDGEWIAGALNFIGRDTLYGRYWGCTEYHPALHFELCYYQAIEYAILTGLTRVEAGAQGEHKIARGYLPVHTHSLHWIRDPAFSAAVARYLEAEKEAIDEEIEILTDFGPFRKTMGEERQ
ncbi:GNAT family N-acetyltransferase [Pontibaca methylaminivorans]|uniref:Uncharacterized protein n=1 Tax=Pontibaca methylaminivorans TaxID=515897 RepID=A0A1R3WRP6_9RHOB|nr:GNAT family N-acetyltransferase [Pontibaca methylaminivorans]SIT79943.1 hypothetical protein SAMN05421849_1226 [Pontibaca methylaminivorans]